MEEEDEEDLVTWEKVEEVEEEGDLFRLKKDDIFIK